MKRIFSAIKINPQPALTNFISKLQHQLADSVIKWVETENLHLTLKFFGETHEEKITEIESVLKNIHVAPFDFEIGNLKIFGSRYNPRVLFLEALNSGPFVILSGLVNEQLKPLGYETDRQNFVPHLTLGRIKSISDKKYFQEIISNLSGKTFQSQHVAEFHLFESILHASGPEYKILKSFSL
jgi:RNA 2',3'-cyclic 3'-phosphodiesterase